MRQLYPPIQSVMAYYFLQTLIPLALLLASGDTVRSAVVSTFFTYDFYGDQPTSLTYQGDAHFPSDTTFLRLTNTEDAGGARWGTSIGRAVHSIPVLFRTQGAQANFETTLKFIFTPVRGFDPADGLTFFIAPVGYPIPPNSTGGNLGIFNSSTGSLSPSVFAVEFDTFVNDWDPQYRHVGIDIESHASVNHTRVDDAIIGKAVTARINYVGATNQISVKVTAGEQVFEVSFVHDLGTVLPEQVQVGISAATTTGSRATIHDVVSWYFTSTVIEIDAAVPNEGIPQIV